MRYRPGPLEAIVDQDKYGNTTMAEKYIENGDPKELERFMEDIPPQLRHIYEKTRGILIYQEQIMALAQEMAGYTLGGADLLRRAIGKKIKELLQALKYEFIYGTEKGVELLENEIAKLEAVEEDKRDKKAIDIYKKQLKEMKKALSEGKGVLGAVNKGYTEEYATKTFDAIERFAGYCFNKSHSVAYSLIAYYTAYLKTHYPVEFMTAQLTIDNAETEDILKNINECRRLGIPILPPDINKSSLGYSIEEIEIENEHGVKVKKKAIRYGMDSIKGVGEAVVQEIIKKPAHPDGTAQEGDTYTSFKDFYERVNKRVVNKGYIEKLIMAGCFDSFNPNRYEVLNEFYFNCRKSKKFEGTEKEFAKAKRKKEIKSDTELYRDPATFNVDVICKMEEEVIGFYLTHHPYEELPYEALDAVPDYKQVDIGGKIIKVKSHTMKNGKPMCFLTLDTIGGKVDVTLFNDTFEQYHEECFEGNIVIVRGKKQTRNDKPQIILSKLMKPRKKKFKVERPEDAPVLIEKQEKTSTPSEEVKTLEEDIFTQPRPNPTADLFSWVEEMEQETMKKDEPKKEVWEELASLFD